MEVNDFFHIGVKIGLLLDAIAYLQEERFVDEVFDATYREMRHEILPIAEVAKIVESVEDVFFKIVECLRLVLHTEPEDTR